MHVRKKVHLVHKISVITGQSDNTGKVLQFQPNNAFKPRGENRLDKKS